MLFSSLMFVFRFLPVFFLIYILVPANFRTGVLLAGSLIFYAFGEPYYVFLLLGELGINYGLYRLGRRRGSRLPAKAAAVLDVLTLVLFKYSHILKLPMPLGISFYTFQLISFLADEALQKKEKSSGAPVSFPAFATYISMFPQLVAGPIVQYREVERELRENAFSWDGLELGLKQFSVGLGFKVLLANQIGTLWTSVQSAGTVGLGAATAWLGAIAYTFQIYFDFFGYSLMAIGLGTMLGFRLPENFLEPYSATSFSEFWRRWHVTLGRWFREYAYIPLGGSRGGTARTIRNLFLVWALTGIWHGAGWNYLIWGLGFFVLLVLEKYGYGSSLERHRVLGHLYVIVLLPLNWTVFGITDTGALGAYLKAMLGLTSGEILTGGDVFLRYLWTYGVLLAVCLLFATPLPRRIWNRYRDTLWMAVLIFAVFAFSMYELSKGGSNPFLYFRF